MSVSQYFVDFIHVIMCNMYIRGFMKVKIFLSTPKVIIIDNIIARNSNYWRVMELHVYYTFKHMNKIRNRDHVSNFFIMTLRDELRIAFIKIVVIYRLYVN